MKPSPIDCSQVQAHLPLHAGADLESPGAEAVAEHLETCRACAAEFARLKAALGAFDELRREPAPAIDVWAGVRAGLEREQLLRRAAPASRSAAPSRLWFRVAPLAAAAAVAAVAWLGWRDGAPASAPESAAPETRVAATVPESAAVAPAVQQTPLDPRGLRRAAPDEERMWLRAQEFPSSRFSGSVDGPWSFASDHVARELR